jgi:hypothetical protein
MNCKCGGSFDEYALCFECGKPRPMTSAERKAAERARKAARGLKEVRGLWCTPEEEKVLKAFYVVHKFSRRQP